MMLQPNQIDRLRRDVCVTTDDLLSVPQGEVTERGVRQNVNVGIQYIESWRRGQGAAAINHLMEDMATAEISRTQLWQWIQHGVVMADGRKVTGQLARQVVAEELDSIRATVGEECFRDGNYELASQLIERVALQKDWIDFLTLVGYDYLQ